MLRKMFLTRERTIEFSQLEEKPLLPAQVRARALMSGISHGTEISLFRGTSPFHTKAFDPGLRIFKDVSPENAYPVTLGYEWVGRVTEVGEDVQAFKTGDLVHLPFPHAEAHTFAPADMQALGVTAPLPETVRPEQAIFVATTSIALQAIHDARIKTGDHVVVFGLGVLGLLAVQLAKLSGAQRVDAVDPIASRRRLAETFGATATYDPLNSDPGLEIKTATKGADVAIEFSGNYGALHQAIRSVRLAGLVVAAGFYQGGAEALRLGEEWLHNRVSMVASSRGWGATHRDAPMWDRARVRATAIDLMATGQLSFNELLTHRIPFDDAQRAYSIIDTGGEDVLKVAFDY